MSGAASIDVAAELRAAARQHRSGQRDAAETLYRAVLAAEPDNDNALYLLGTLLHQKGAHREGLRLLTRAIEIDGTNSSAFNNRALVFQALGRYQAQLADLMRAVEIKPDYPEAHNNMGDVLVRLGRADEAEAAYRKAIALRPDYAESYCGLARAARKAGRLAESAARYEDALRLKPGLVAALVELADVIEMSGADGAALAPRIYAEFDRLAGQAPVDAESLRRLAIALAHIGHTRDAIERLAALLKREPDNAGLHHAIGFVHSLAGEFVSAIGHMRRALWHKPDHMDAGFHLATMLLLTGHCAAGWPYYEHRLRLPWALGVARRKRSIANRWHGEDLRDRTILIHAEQGLGDVLNFARFVPLVAARSGRTILEVPESVRAVMERSFAPAVEVIRGGGRLPKFDFHCPIMSLPLELGIGSDLHGGSVPYLKVDPEKAAGWHEFFRARNGALAVGLVWAGNPVHPGDEHRSIDLAVLAPLLLMVSGVRFFSFQVGLRARDGDAFGPALTRIDARLADFSDTLAALSQIDLLISVDTAVVHAAGAIGAPAWLLLPRSPDWRWQLTGERSPWYPTVRLFRQAGSRSWRPVVERVAEALRGLAAVSLADGGAT